VLLLRSGHQWRPHATVRRRAAGVSTQSISRGERGALLQKVASASGSPLLLRRLLRSAGGDSLLLLSHPSRRALLTHLSSAPLHSSPPHAIALLLQIRAYRTAAPHHPTPHFVIMTDTREDSVYLAKLAEQAERYEGESAHGHGSGGRSSLCLGCVGASREGLRGRRNKGRSA